MVATLKHSLSRMRNEDGRSPRKRNALRVPVQSIDEKIDSAVNDLAESCAMIGALALVVIGFEWLHVLMDMPPRPHLITAIALAVLACSVFRFFRLLRQVRRRKLASDGQRAVGQFLDDKLRPLGFFVLHDICAGNRSIDHVIVGEQGIYTVETRIQSKPLRGRRVVKYDGESVTVGGDKPDRHPVSQATGHAAWLAETLDRGLGLKVPVQAVVVFPGWCIESPQMSRERVWVLEPKQLPALVVNNRQSIASSTASTVSRFLRQLVRAA